METFDRNRRSVLKGSAAAMAMGTIASFGALYSRQAAAVGDPLQLAPVPSPYGPVAPVVDGSTGLPLLQLPPGFSYRSFGWTGDLMDDGQPCPGSHDGMAVLRLTKDSRSRFDLGDRSRAQGPAFVLVRNHERGVGDLIQAPGVYDDALLPPPFSNTAAGGTTNLHWRRGQWLGMEGSLGGTLVNCAGGPTPWGTWLTCEEIKTDIASASGRRHGYVFEVHANAERTTGIPLVGLGRFSHEAVAVDPRTGCVYLTEDDRNKSGFYRFIPNDAGNRFRSLENGGRLQAARVVGQANADLIVAAIGDEYQIEWVDIADPDMDGSFAPLDFPDVSPGETLSGPFAQAWDEGALRMSRGEGIWHSAGKLFIVDTSTGLDSENRRGRGEGCVWVYDIAAQRLKALYVSGNPLAGNNPDNITVSPRGGVVLCEDGGNSPDEFGPGSRLLGLNPLGEAYYFCKNNIELTAEQIADAGKTIDAGDYRGFEFCGACWDPFGRTMFVNIQTPGITFAITGPWRSGNL